MQHVKNNAKFILSASLFSMIIWINVPSKAVNTTNAIQLITTTECQSQCEQCEYRCQKKNGSEFIDCKSDCDNNGASCCAAAGGHHPSDYHCDCL